MFKQRSSNFKLYNNTRISIQDFNEYWIVQEMDTWYRTMFQEMGDATAKHAQSVRSLREEIAVYRKNVSLFLNFILVYGYMWHMLEITAHSRMYLFRS